MKESHRRVCETRRKTDESEEKQKRKETKGSPEMSPSGRPLNPTRFREIHFPTFFSLFRASVPREVFYVFGRNL
jgi:hypothetical protein